MSKRCNCAASPLRASDDNPLPTEGVENLLLIWLVFWLSVILSRTFPIRWISGFSGFVSITAAGAAGDCHPLPSYALVHNMPLFLRLHGVNCNSNDFWHNQLSNYFMLDSVILFLLRDRIYLFIYTVVTSTDLLNLIKINILFSTNKKWLISFFYCYFFGHL